MKCPFCGEEMHQGNISSGRYILWNMEDEKGKKQEYLIAKSYMGGAKLAGELCLSCRKLVLEVPEME